MMTQSAHPRARRLAIGLIVATAAAIPIAVATHAAAPDGTPSLAVDNPTVDLADGATEAHFTVTLTEQGAPTTTTTVATTTPSTIAPLPSATPVDALPATGTDITPFAIAAAALLAAGTTVVAIRRRPGAVPIIVVGTALAATGPAVASTTPSEPTEPNVTVPYRTVDGTATAPGDYTTTTGILTFTDGDTTGTISVPINPSGTGGTFTLELHNPVGAALSDPTGTATLLPPLTSTTTAASTASTTTALITTTTTPSATTSTTTPTSTTSTTTTTTSTTTTTTSTTTTTTTTTEPSTTPTAADDSFTVIEDAPATAIPVLDNDLGGSLLIATVTQPRNGTVVITGGGTGLEYGPDANYCNDSGGVPDTFLYSLVDGSAPAIVSVTVTCVDDPPIALDDAITVVENSGATAIDVLANDVDLDSSRVLTIGSVAPPFNGTVSPAGGSSHLTYLPDPDFCGTDTFTYTILPGGSRATVSVTVTCTDT